MRFVIAKPISGHWHYYQCRNHWSISLDLAMLLGTPNAAWDEITLMSDGDEIDATVLYVDVIVDHTVRLEYQKRIRIVVDGGDLFDGDLAQFEDCFFSNTCIEQIKDWAQKQGHKVEFFDHVTNEPLANEDN